jgi:DNA-binding XRE family transcriptional regulator
METSMKIDGDKVRVLREQKAWSQEHLASVAGLSVRTIQRVESEGGGLPETRLALSAALGVTAAELMGEAPAGAPASPQAVPGAKWGWIGWGAGVTCSLTGIFFGFLGNGSLPEALRALGVVGALAGITAGLIGVLRERHRRQRQAT